MTVAPNGAVDCGCVGGLATVISLPLDTQINASIQGGIDDKKPAGNEARFTIRVARAAVEK